MSFKMFGLFLLEKGEIDREALLDALEYQRTVNFPLGVLAVERKLLTVEQAGAINMEQRRADRKFGEIAVQMGFLTELQVIELLRAQKECWIQIGKALVIRGHIAAERLESVLKEHEKEQEETQIEFEAVVQSLPNVELIQIAMSTMMTLFQRIVHQKLEISISVTQTTPQDRIEKLKAKILGYHRFFSQTVSGDKNFHFCLALPKPVILTIASKMIGFDQTEVNELSLDGVCEFCNTIVGNIAGKLDSKGFEVRVTPPRSFESLGLTPSFQDCVGFDMRCSIGDFLVSILFPGGASSNDQPQP